MASTTFQRYYFRHYRASARQAREVPVIQAPVCSGLPELRGPLSACPAMTQSGVNGCTSSEIWMNCIERENCSSCHPRKRAKESGRVCLGSIATAADVLGGTLFLRNRLHPTQQSSGVWIPSSRRFGAPWDDGSDWIERRGKTSKTWMNPMCRLFAAFASPLPRPNHPDEDTLGVVGQRGLMGEWGGAGTEKWMNPMRPSLTVGREAGLVRIEAPVPTQPTCTLHGKCAKPAQFISVLI